MIKLRAWDTVKKAMSEVQAIVYTEEKVYPIYSKEIRRYIPFSEAILMQSTGLFDINDKEIFEGDIVRISMRIGKRTTTSIGAVEFDKFEVCFRIRNDLGGHYVTMFHARYFEVIGNIYQNQELVEG